MMESVQTLVPWIIKSSTTFTNEQDWKKMHEPHT